MSSGTVVQAFGNLLQVRFEGHIRQGEVGFVDVDGEKLKAEVIEIVGQEAKIQVYEDTKGISLGAEVEFSGDLLEAELGPGLLTSIFDGLQNPLPELAEEAGVFLPRGIYLPPLNREKKWEYTPTAKVGDRVRRGDSLGSVPEGRFDHQIMVPFQNYGESTLTWVIEPGSYTVDTVVAKAGDREFTMMQKWPIKAALLEGEKVSKPSRILSTGLRTIDTQFPIRQGGTFCTPGPFGAGKTVLQHHLAKYSDVDIVVVCACGERAGEVVEVVREFPQLTDPHTGGTLIERTIIICNTSSMPVAARESSVYLGITMAEYYRQMGLNVLLLADSTSRWAQALREMSGRLEEIPGEEAFPAYLASRIAEFYERSGVVGKGSVTICGAVSPAGGNFEEPVTQATLGVVGAFLGLSRARSDARRYPAVDPLISWSKFTEEVASDPEKVYRTAELLREGDEIGRRMEVVGEEGTAIDDLVTYLKAELYDFVYLQQNAFDKEDAYCPAERQTPVFALLSRLFDANFKFANHDAARTYFLDIQNKFKNMNFLAFESAEYNELFAAIERQIDEASKQ